MSASARTRVSRNPGLPTILAALAFLALGAWALTRWWAAEPRTERSVAAPAEESEGDAPPAAIDLARPDAPTGAAMPEAKRAESVAVPEERSTRNADAPATESTDPRVRFDELRRLASKDPARAAAGLLQFIEDTRDSERVLLQRLEAVTLLGELEGVGLWHELVDLYEREDAGVRRAAALALAKQGDDSLVERELTALEGELADADGGLRARAAESVAALSSPRAVPTLVRLLDDSNSDVRAHAVDGLWRAADPLALPEAERMLADPVAKVRERAERAVEALRALQSGAGGPSAR